MANILKKIAKALTPKKSKKKSTANTGLSWTLDRYYTSKQKYEQSYSPKRKKPARAHGRQKAKKA